MYGDFSRSHRADARRNKTYWRALLQQGRPLLDSDVNALVDTQDANLRRLTRAVGCEAGTSDGGFFVTPGPLLARFEDFDHVTASAAPFKANRDYGHKLVERLPSLHLDATAGAGQVTIRLRRTITSAEVATVRLWMCGAAVPEVSFDGTTFTTPSGGPLDPVKFAPFEVPVPASGTLSQLVLRLAGGATSEAYVALVEGRQNAGKKPTFWVTKGGYLLEGWQLARADDGTFPAVSFPSEEAQTFADAGLTAGQLVVAYLEGRERAITRAEDPGILENALGGAVDTWTRTVVTGPVKLARTAGLPPTPSEADIAGLAKAFTNVDLGSGTLKIEPRGALAVDDPCAIPTSGAYTGAENRLYRFEVHVPGNLGTAVIKWSRNNAADVWSALELQASTVKLPVWCDLKNGDLVELLNDPTELLDANPAQTGGGKLVPAAQQVGSLFYVTGRTESATDVTFGLLALDPVTGNKSPAAIPASVRALKRNRLRRWSGYFKTPATAPFEKVVEDNIKLTFGGADFRAGLYWQYEARKLPNETGASLQPNGPERGFAPLALLRWKGENEPMEVVAWLDHSFHALCDLRADDVAYDGAGAGTSADTVQEAIDELYRREAGGCCDVTMGPGKPGDDDGARLQQLIMEKLPTGGVVCLERGSYSFRTLVQLKDGHWEIRGCPEAFIDAEGPAFYLRNETTLTLKNLNVFGHAPALVRLDDIARFFAHTCILAVDRPDEHTAVVLSGGEIRPIPPLQSSVAPFLPPEPKDAVKGTRIRFHDCFVSSTAYCVLGENLMGVDIRRSVLVGEAGAVRGAFLGPLIVEDGYVLSNGPLLQRPAVETKGRSAGDEWLSVLLNSTVSGGGTAIYAERLTDADLLNSTLTGDVGLRAVVGTNMDVEDCVFGTSAIGIRLDEAHEINVRGGAIHGGEGDGVHIPALVRASTIQDVAITAARAILLLADWDPDADPKVYAIPTWRIAESAHVSGCHVSSTKIGIQLGRLDGGIDAGLVERVLVESNTVDATSLSGAGISVAPLTGTTGGARPQVLLSDNAVHVEARGILAAGDGLVVDGNHVFARVSSVASPAVSLRNTVGAVVTDNVVELSVDPNGVLGGGAFVVDGGSGAHLRGNTVRCTFYAIPVWARSHSGLRLSDNEFEEGSSEIRDCAQMTVRGNLLGQRLTVASCTDGVVSDNQLNYAESTGLVVGPVSGRWQVQNNQLRLGSLSVFPVTKPLFFNSLTEEYQPLVAGLTYTRSSGPRPDMLSRARAVDVAARVARTSAPTDSAASHELADTGRALAVREQLDAALMKLAEDVKEIAPLWFWDQELDYQVQIEGNWAQNLNVGTDAWFGGGGSVVQVTGNRVDGSLYVRYYLNAVVALNAAISLNVGAGTAPINEKNLDF